MSTPQKVLDLIEVFDRNADDYLSAHFNEAMLRQQFVNPLFKCLGWDMDNEQGYAEAYKDVIHEAAIKIGGATKAPDYSFRIGGAPKFYLEAKKPAVNIKDDPGPAFQLRRYAWSARMPLSILTNFREFAVYDCRVKPVQTDKASTARILYLRCGEFAAAWDEKIAGVFSREAVLKGSFDRFADSKKAKRGTAAVDAAFLDEIETWREELAKNLALRNPELSSRELNFAVQITIDRIIFLRMCEDRGIEPYGRLKNLQTDPDVYDGLRALYRKADERYNSGLFHFHKEKDRAESPDELTPRLKIDDKVLKSIFRGLYYPDSPYEFSVLPVEILGQVYEQFLGKVIRLTAAHQAKVEEKPEVKKAGGVYYTPSYIVDYIVGHTVGRLLEGKTPKEAARLTVLDPACGSGSFLLGAYRSLLEWHLKQYEQEGPEKHKKELFQAVGGAWRLTTGEKKRILLNNLYGVDIDPRAVEVTKLSLLLKVLEGESQETIETQLKLFHERALPDLASNVKCGNSLIGPDFYEGRQAALFDEEERYRINVFDWDAMFPKIMKAGGFDAVIGNPPYVLLQDEFRDDEQLAYFRAKYTVASYKVDTYHLFMEAAVRLTAAAGRCSMITPANFLTNNHLAALRRLILEQSDIDHLVVIDGGVFDGISVDNAIFVLTCGKPTAGTFSVQHAVRDDETLHTTSELAVVAERAREDKHVLYTGTSAKGTNALWTKILHVSTTLGGIADVNFGKQLRDRKQYRDDVITVQALEAIHPPYKACYTGRDVCRYRVVWAGLACLDQEAARRGGCWDPAKQNATNKLLTRQIGRHPEFAVDLHGYQCLNTMFMVNLSDPSADWRFVLGILNSSLLRAFWIDRFFDQRRTFPKIKGSYLKQLPVYAINATNPGDQARHDRMAQLVEHMLALHKRLAAANAPHDKTVLQAQIDATDRQIDRLVYDLYGLTEEEIRIVEGGTAT